jgi:hypothetical protein
MFEQFVDGHFHVAQNGTKQTWSDGFTPIEPARRSPFHPDASGKYGCLWYELLESLPVPGCE